MVTQQQRGMSRRVTSLEQENERLRELLSIARQALSSTVESLEAYGHKMHASVAFAEWVASDPDASTEGDVTP